MPEVADPVDLASSCWATSPRERCFFAAGRRLPLELLRRNGEIAQLLIDRARAAAKESVIPDADGVLGGMRGYAAHFAGDAATCVSEAVVFERCAVDLGLAAVRAEAAVIWLGADRPDKVAEMIGAFTPDVLAALPRDSDWLLILQCLLEGAVAVADREVAESVVALLAPYGGRSVVNAGAVMWHGVTDDTLARGFALLGDAAAAARHRSAALATYQRIGATWWRNRLSAALTSPPRPTGEPTVHLHQQPGGLWLVGAQAVAGQTGLEVLDQEARRAYRTRLDELDPERDAVERTGCWTISTPRPDSADITGRQGRPTNGPGSRRARRSSPRSPGSPRPTPGLARHLRDHVSTGLSCRYEQDPDHPLRWLLGEAG